MRLNISARLLRFDIDYYLGLVETHAWRDWSWVGEQSGKWLDASILCSETFRHEQLHDRAASVLKRMLAAQQEDGYLGVTDPALRTPGQPLRGMDAYELYFILHSLLTAHDEWGSDAALTSAARAGDYLVRYIGPGKAEFWPKPKESTIAGHAVHGGLEGTLLIDPMMRLYERTGEKKYLDWCQWVVANIDKWSGTRYYSRLDDVARGELGIHQLLPKVHAHTFQMNALGLMRMYFATGDSDYLNKVRGAWNDISSKRTYITGAPSHHEYYLADFDLPNEGEGVETCGVMSWIQLNQALLNATGDTAYADMIERAMWNHTYASQTWEGDGFRYGVPMTGWKPSMYFTGPNCCSGSGPRMLGLLPGMIYGRSSDALYVNQFMDSSAQIELGSLGTVAITQRTEYPNDEKVSVVIRPARDMQFELKIRIPSWCGKPAILVNGSPASDIRSGSYATIRRTWKSGDQVEIRLPMETKWVRGAHSNSGLWALTRGPVVYAADGAWQTKDVCTTLATTTAPSPVASTVRDRPPDPVLMSTPADALGPFYKTEAKLKDGRSEELVLSPFANLGRWYKDPEARPDIKQKLYRYSVWMPA